MVELFSNSKEPDQMLLIWVCTVLSITLKGLQTTMGYDKLLEHFTYHNAKIIYLQS